MLFCSSKKFVVVYRITILLTMLFCPNVRAMELNEERVIELVLEKNLGIKISGKDRDSAAAAVLQTKGYFDTTLFAEADYLIDKRDQLIPIFGTDNRIVNWNVRLNRNLPTGTQLTLEWLNQRSRTDSPFATINPSYDARWGLGVRQALLNNILGVNDRSRVSAAKRRFESVDLATRRRAELEIYAVLTDYWKWVVDQKNVAVTLQSVNEARRFESLSGEKKKIGVYAETDVLAASANLLQMRNEYDLAVLERDNSLARLKKGLDWNEGETFSSSQSVPMEKLPDLASLKDISLAQRSDLASLRKEIEAKRLETRAAKNQLLPSLDFVASYQSNGIDSAYGQALDEVTGLDHPAYRVGGELRWSIENRSARGLYRRATSELQKSTLEMRNLENQIILESEEALRTARTLKAQVENNRRIESLQRQKWRQEMERYGQGQSSSDLIIRYQEDFLRSQRATLLSLYRYRLATLNLKLVQNTLLDGAL